MSTRGVRVCWMQHVEQRMIHPGLIKVNKGVFDAAWVRQSIITKQQVGVLKVVGRVVLPIRCCYQVYG